MAMQHSDSSEYTWEHVFPVCRLLLSMPCSHKSLCSTKRKILKWEIFSIVSNIDSCAGWNCYTLTNACSSFSSPVNVSKMILNVTLNRKSHFHRISEVLMSFVTSTCDFKDIFFLTKKKNLREVQTFCLSVSWCYVKKKERKYHYFN